MAYDAQRQKVVLFGGYGPTGAILGDTWEWDGQSWAGVSASGPAPRLGHAVAYDAGRRKTVLFGGFTYGNGNPHFADTWEWDGQAWTAVAANGPSARAQHAMAYHAPLGGAISYGGSYFSTFFADTWLFNGNSWSQIINGPAARERSAIAYDAARARTVMFGGSGGTNSALASTYEMRGGINSASATPFGTGCSGSSGVPALVNSNGSLPRPGGSLQLAVTNLPPIATVCTPFFGTSNQWFNATQLPAPLEAYGMPGCTLYADVFGTGFALSLGGTATWSFSLPLNGNLVGLHVYVQALVFDPNASNPAGIATTNAIDALIGA